MQDKVIKKTMCPAKRGAINRLLFINIPFNICVEVLF
jgi:hypothetical protein